MSGGVWVDPDYCPECDPDGDPCAEHEAMLVEASADRDADSAPDADAVRVGAIQELHRENMDILTEELRGAKARHRRDLLELHQAASAAGAESIVDRIGEMLDVVHMDNAGSAEYRRELGDKIAPEE